ncbi:hypothetical protein AGMMS49574_03930 [Bacteroidia bacterium]|nr:hypothetical protein AGMMS49574_03930 [Bacteroidia bacterium]
MIVSENKNYIAIAQATLGEAYMNHCRFQRPLLSLPFLFSVNEKSRCTKSTLLEANGLAGLGAFDG